MIVGKRMQSQPVTLMQNQSLLDASKTMKKTNVRHIPVVNENRQLVGIITDNDVKKASASDATTLDIHELLYLLDNIKVEDVMIKKVIVVPPDLPLEEAAKILHDNKFGCLPVVKDQELVGIITISDVLEFLMEAMAVQSDSTRVELELDDQPGALANVLDSIRDHGYSLCAIIASPERIGNKVTVTLRMACDNDYELRKTLEDDGYRIVSFTHHSNASTEE